MNDLPARMMKDEKDVDRPEQDGLDAEEVAGPDLTSMGRDPLSICSRKLVEQLERDR